MRRTPKIEIWGAGVSGLWLARQLLRYNPSLADKLTVYEKSDHVGGRFVMERVGPYGDEVLTGASHVHFNHSSFSHYIQSLMAKRKVPKHQVFTEYMVPVADPVIVVCSRSKGIHLGQRQDLQSIALKASPVHDLYIAHEYCMEVHDIDRAALAVEVNFVDRISGHGHYTITPQLYRIIMEDLSKDIRVVFGRSHSEEDAMHTTAGGRNQTGPGEKISVQCYPPPRWAAKAQYSAVKMYFRLRSNNGVHQYNANGEIPSFLWVEGSLIVEVWPEIPLDRQTYCIFATASRADRLHSFGKGERRRFLRRCARTIFGDESVPIYLGARYWPFAYQHPSFRNMAETIQHSGSGKYMCGEWSSPVFEGSINGAINTAQNLFFKMIVDHPSLHPARRLPT